MNRRFLLVAGTLLLTGCATLPPVAAPVGAGFELLEPLYSATAGRDVLAIRVASNGCTKKDDFAVFVEKTPAGPRVAFGRRTLDRCRSVAQGQIELRFTWSELGLDGRTPVFVANPLVPWTGPGSL